MKCKQIVYIAALCLIAKRLNFFSDAVMKQEGGGVKVGFGGLRTVPNFRRPESVGSGLWFKAEAGTLSSALSSF